MLLDIAIIEWVEKVRSLRPDVARRAREVLEEKSTDYTIEDLECEVLEFEEYNQELEQLVEAAKAAHFAGRPWFEEFKSKTEEIQETVRDAVKWLASVKESQQLMCTASWSLEEPEKQCIED